jgi:hypothetical protein
MWGTVLVLAHIAAIEPWRLGVAFFDFDPAAPG